MAKCIFNFNEFPPDDVTTTCPTIIVDPCLIILEGDKGGAIIVWAENFGQFGQLISYLISDDVIGGNSLELNMHFTNFTIFTQE